MRQLLPAQPPQRSARALRGRPVALADPPSSQSAVVQITVTSGLVRTLDPAPDHPVYLVTAETFQCAVLTLIPSKHADARSDPCLVLLESEQPIGKDGKTIIPATEFGAGPAGLAPAAFQPTLTLTLTVSPSADSVLHAYRRFTNAPKALWEHKSFDNGVPRVDPASGLTQATIPNALTGFTLIPYLDREVPTVPTPLESLLFTHDAQEQRFGWSPGAPPASDPFTDQTVAGTIATPGVADVRAALLDALRDQDVRVTTAVDVSGLARATAGDQVAPRLRLLGEQRAASSPLESLS